MNRSGFIHELWHEDDVALPPAADAENFEAPIASGVLQGAADLVTTAGDIDKWLTALRQKTLLSEESYAEMTQDYSPDDGKYGYGLMLHMPLGVYAAGQGLQLFCRQQQQSVGLGRAAAAGDNAGRKQRKLNLQFILYNA